MPKRYRATFQFGCQSPSDDTEGQVTPLVGAPILSRAAIEQILPQFEGTILQRPPIYSAIKVAGRRSYHLARQGKSVPLQARPITIDRLLIVNYSYPMLELDITCGSGTYVRSLGRDMAATLGSAAVMTALLRTGIGHFSIERAMQSDPLTREIISAHLQSPLEALSEMPRMVLTAAQIELIHNGQFIHAGQWLEGDSYMASELDGPCSSMQAAAIDEEGRLVAIVTPKLGDRWGPVKNFPIIKTES